MANKYDPNVNFSGFEKLQKELNKVFNVEDIIDQVGSAARTVYSEDGWRPAVDIYETEGLYIIEADIPGVDPDTIELSLAANQLTVSGSKITKASSLNDSVVADQTGVDDNTRDEQSVEFKRVERHSGDFYRQFVVPDSVNSDSISATGRHGVLRIEMEKHTGNRKRKIVINT